MQVYITIVISTTIAPNQISLSLFAFMLDIAVTCALFHEEEFLRLSILPICCQRVQTHSANIPEPP